MISDLARGDYDDFVEKGLNPTLDDFDRLNSLALRMTDGAETTAANFPRVGWAGDVPFYQPTYQAFAWYLTYCDRLADPFEKDAAWFYALAQVFARRIPRSPASPRSGLRRHVERCHVHAVHEHQERKRRRVGH